MSKDAGDADEELAKLQVPSHGLPNKTAQNTSPLPQIAEKRCSGGAPKSNAQRLRDRIRPYPLARDTSGYKAVLNDIERRRGREMRRTLRTAEAARKRQQCRNIVLAALLVVALGLAFLLLARLR
ncbi:hypothetical protein N2W54_007412 [Lotmaria passim]